jgi:hypothetical protein
MMRTWRDGEVGRESENPKWESAAAAASGNWNNMGNYKYNI